jgi:hypothetical protein
LFRWLGELSSIGRWYRILYIDCDHDLWRIHLIICAMWCIARVNFKSREKQTVPLSYHVKLMPNLVTNYFCIKIVEKTVTEWLKISFFLNKQVTYVTLNNIAFISRMRIKYGFPPILLVSSCCTWQPFQFSNNECLIPSKIMYPCFDPLQVKEPKVYVHGNLENNAVVNKIWPGCL